MKPPRPQGSPHDSTTPGQAARPDPETADRSKLTEAELLTVEAEQARAAMGKVTSDLVALLKDSADLKAIVGDHPWALLGAAAVAGFAVASAVTPSRDQTFAERLKSLVPEKPAPSLVLVPAEAAAAMAAAPVAAAAQPAAKSGAISSAMHHLFDAVKTAVITTLTSAISAKVVQQETGGEAARTGGGTGEGDGHPPAAPGPLVGGA